MNELRRLKRDPALFAERLLGVPLWPHQREVVESKARQRAICSGRQAGKSTVVGVEALHTAYAKPGAFVLIVSAGEQAAKDLLATCSALAASPLLTGSVVDDNKSEMVLSNGSRIRSIPQSQRQARGPSADLLIVDEASFVDEQVWTAAKFTTVARRDSRILMASTPFGRPDRFFAVAYRAGLAGVDGYESFHWPSTVSPLVDQSLIAQWQQTDPDRVFRAEVLAEWVDDQGAYFTADELDAACRDYAFVSGGVDAVAGVDWGFAHDANTLALLAKVGGRAEEFGVSPESFWIPHLSEQFRTTYSAWIDHIVEVVSGFRLRRLLSEMNGVGAMPTQELAARLGWRVDGVHTDVRLKEDAFGRIKVLLQNERLVLPRHPSLLTQLHALEYEHTDTGAVKISVPERFGHDDVAMCLALAVRADPAIGVIRSPSGPVSSSARVAAERWLPSNIGPHKSIEVNGERVQLPRPVAPAPKRKRYRSVQEQMLAARGFDPRLIRGRRFGG
jgi:hypothetical protein